MIYIAAQAYEDRITQIEEANKNFPYTIIEKDGQAIEVNAVQHMCTAKNFWNFSVRQIGDINRSGGQGYYDKILINIDLMLIQMLVQIGQQELTASIRDRCRPKEESG